MNSRIADSPEIAPATDDFIRALNGCTRVLLIGGYGCGNIGDEAILSVLLGELRSARIHIHVVSADPKATNALHAVTSVVARPGPVARAIAWSDAVVIGGGGIFSRYMGARSCALPLVALAARRGRRQVLFRALGVYPSTPPLVLRALVLAMSRASFVSVRDDASVRTLANAGLRTAPLLEPDPALRLPRSAAAQDLPDRAVGLALRRVRDAALQARLEPVFVQVLDSLVAVGRTPVLLPFCDHPNQLVEQDLHYAEVLRSRCAGPEHVDVMHVNHPGQMLDIVGRLDGLVAMRFHAIAFGSMSSTPMIALPYDDKCSEFASANDVRALALAGLDPAELVFMIGAATSRTALLAAA